MNLQLHNPTKTIKITTFSILAFMDHSFFTNQSKKLKKKGFLCYKKVPYPQTWLKEEEEKKEEKNESKKERRREWKRK